MRPDTLLDLHAKLQTAVRYYDRMLEDRLSKAFNHQNLGGYNLPPPRQSSGPYPNLQANVPTSHAGPAESFYTGEAQHAQPSYPYPTQPTPQPQYANYDQRASIAGPPQHQYPQQQQQQPPRQDSWRASAPPGQYPPQPNYPPSETATPQMSHLSLPQQQPNASESVGTTPTSDPNASFYFQQPGQNPLASPSAPPEAAPSPYPNLQQPPQQYPQQAQNGPETSTPTAHAQQTHQQPPQQQAPPAQQQHQQQPQAPYWQHPAAQHVQMPAQPSAPWQQAPPQQQQPPQYAGYQQEAFPSAPQHAIAAPKPVVEEALIEL
jgi:hepatocyte growth factor-regulated tyrosine kinase substrate